MKRATAPSRMYHIYLHEISQLHATYTIVCCEIALLWSVCIARRAPGPSVGWRWAN